jgi:transcriptional regulator with XRE-family HTH domain
MFADKVPKNIRKFRELKDLTREDMAAYLEMSSSGYAKIEQGIVDVSIRKMEQIASILKVEAKQLMEFEVNQVFNSDEKESKSNTDASGNHQPNNFDSDFYYLEKLVQSLERENEMLRKQLENKK